MIFAGVALAILVCFMLVYLAEKFSTTMADPKPTLPKTYTQEEVNRLVLEEREKCARIADGYAVHTTETILLFGEFAKKGLTHCST